jgi:hypothetical protein
MVTSQSLAPLNMFEPKKILNLEQYFFVKIFKFSIFNFEGQLDFTFKLMEVYHFLFNIL